MKWVETAQMKMEISASKDVLMILDRGMIPILI
jgi:hypothetical protein